MDEPRIAGLYLVAMDEVQSAILAIGNQTFRLEQLAHYFAYTIKVPRDTATWQLLAWAAERGIGNDQAVQTINKVFDTANELERITVYWRRRTKAALQDGSGITAHETMVNMVCCASFEHGGRSQIVYRPIPPIAELMATMAPAIDEYDDNSNDERRHAAALIGIQLAMDWWKERT